MGECATRQPTLFAPPPRPDPCAPHQQPDGTYRCRWCNKWERTWVLMNNHGPTTWRPTVCGRMALLAHQGGIDPTGQRDNLDTITDTGLRKFRRERRHQLDTINQWRATNGLTPWPPTEETE